MSHPALLAIQAEIVQKRATTLKEACPFPLPVVGSMEAFVTDRDEPEAARLFVWWWLSATKISPKAKKNKARRARQKAQLQRARELTASTPTKTKETAKKPSRDDRVPAKEWQQITSFKYSGPKRCPFYNCSLGCRFGDQCRQKHACVECGKDHPWHGNH
eukprot:s3333_g1.t1